MDNTILLVDVKPQDEAELKQTIGKGVEWQLMCISTYGFQS